MQTAAYSGNKKAVRLAIKYVWHALGYEDIFSIARLEDEELLREAFEPSEIKKTEVWHGCECLDLGIKTALNEIDIGNLKGVKFFAKIMPDKMKIRDVMRNCTFHCYLPKYLAIFHLSGREEEYWFLVAWMSKAFPSISSLYGTTRTNIGDLTSILYTTDISHLGFNKVEDVDEYLCSCYRNRKKFEQT